MSNENLSQDPNIEGHELGGLPAEDVVDITTSIAEGEGLDEYGNSLTHGRGENAIELKEVEGLSQGRIVFRRFIRHRGAMVATLVLIAVILLVATSIGWGPIPGWWQWNHIDAMSVVNVQGAPTWNPELTNPASWFNFGPHPFGQDNIGRDVFAVVMRGTQTSLTVMFVIGVLATFIGTVLGAISGFFGRNTDNVIMRFTDMITIIPVIMIGAILGRMVGGASPWTLAVALSFVTWTTMTRLVRAQFMALRELEFVDAARVAGASNLRIMFKHILPNTVGVMIVNTTLLMASAILLETALSFLGFGIQRPEVSLGNLITEGAAAFTTRPFIFWWPGVFIVTIALCVNFIGDGLRDAFDPRQRRIPTARALAKANAKADARAAKDLAKFGKNAADPLGSSLTDPQVEIQREARRGNQL